MLGQRLWRWLNIKTTVGQRLVLARNSASIKQEVHLK